MPERLINDILCDLDAEGALGLDLSPGNDVCREAAELIRYLRERILSMETAAEAFQLKLDVKKNKICKLHKYVIDKPHE